MLSYQSNYHIIQMHFQYLHFELLPLVLATLFMFYLDKTHAPLTTMITVFWVCFAVNIVLILSFLYSTIRQITAYLGIECFTLKKVPRKL